LARRTCGPAAGASLDQQNARLHLLLTRHSTCIARLHLLLTRHSTCIASTSAPPLNKTFDMHSTSAPPLNKTFDLHSEGRENCRSVKAAPALASRRTCFASRAGAWRGQGWRPARQEGDSARLCGAGAARCTRTRRARAQQAPAEASSCGSAPAPLCALRALQRRLLGRTLRRQGGTERRD
jgi:hypothetical protein